jgi:hypothetical protein
LCRTGQTAKKRQWPLLAARLASARLPRPSWRCHRGPHHAPLPCGCCVLAAVGRLGLFLRMVLCHHTVPSVFGSEVIRAAWCQWTLAATASTTPLQPCVMVLSITLQLLSRAQRLRSTLTEIKSPSATRPTWGPVRTRSSL